MVLLIVAESDKKFNKEFSDDERRKTLDDERRQAALDEIVKLSAILDRSLAKIDGVVNELNVTLMALLILQDKIKKSERRLGFNFGNKASLSRLSQDVSTAAKVLGNWMKRFRKNSKETEDDTNKFVNNTGHQE